MKLLIPLLSAMQILARLIWICLDLYTLSQKKKGDLWLYIRLKKRLAIWKWKKKKKEKWRKKWSLFFFWQLVFLCSMLGERGVKRVLWVNRDAGRFPHDCASMLNGFCRPAFSQCFNLHLSIEHPLSNHIFSSFLLSFFLFFFFLTHIQA